MNDELRASGGGSALSVERLSAWYGEAQVLWDVNLAVGPGEGLGILGRNGAGKTTLLRAIAGVHRRTTGSVSFDDRPTLGRPPFHIARQGLSLVREGAPVFAELTVADNIKVGDALAAGRGQDKLERDVIWQSFPVLETMQARSAGQLSGGQRQLLALATALASRPRLLLLDEPSGGLAPQAAASAFAAIAELRKGGLGVLIAEQNREWLTGVTTRTVEIESGRMVGAAVQP